MKILKLNIDLKVFKKICKDDAECIDAGLVGAGTNKKPYHLTYINDWNYKFGSETTIQFIDQQVKRIRKLFKGILIGYSIEKQDFKTFEQSYLKLLARAIKQSAEVVERSYDKKDTIDISKSVLIVCIGMKLGEHTEDIVRTYLLSQWNYALELADRILKDPNA